MFEDNYRREMNDLRAPESLIADTVKSMQNEGTRLQGLRSSETTDEQKVPGKLVTFSYKLRTQRGRNLFLLRVVLPAACLALVLIGALVFPQVFGGSSRNNPQGYQFQLVIGNPSIHGGPLFGSIDNQPNGVVLHMKQAECTEALLPEGILKAKPATFGSYKVYLGYDEQQTTCYAAYRTDNSRATWTLLQSTDLDKTAFVEELKIYFTSLK